MEQTVDYYCSILNLRVYCLNNNKLYNITCQSDNLYYFTNFSIKIHCLVPASTSLYSINCYLVDNPTIIYLTHLMQKEKIQLIFQNLEMLV